MPNFAQVTLVGHLGRDPETRQAGQGTVCQFSIATSRKRGETEITTWWSCSAWDKRGTVIARYLRKGDPVMIVGEPQLRPWTDQDGAQRHQLEVIVDQVTLLGGRAQGDSAGAGGRRDDRGGGAPGSGDLRQGGRRYDRNDGAPGSGEARSGGDGGSQSAPPASGRDDFDDSIPF